MELKEPKRKKNFWFIRGDPLPVNKITKNSKIPCKFNGYSVIVENKNDWKILYTNGCFGKTNLSKRFLAFRSDDEIPIIRKRQFEQRKKLSEEIKSSKQSAVIVVPDSDSENEDYLSNFKPEYKIDKSGIKEKLFLSLEEAFFLVHALDCIEIFDDSGRALSTDDVWNIFVDTNPYFVQNYAVYYYFRAKEWVVKPGLKFGGDFLLYREGPSINHASYVVIIDVIDPETFKRREDLCKRKMKLVDLVGLNRLCENCGKELLICQLLWPEDVKGNTSADIQKLSINDVVTKRWIPEKERVKDCGDADNSENKNKS